ncbi:unnamed protein product [Absidia cylindrospora]
MQPVCIKIYNEQQTLITKSSMYRIKTCRKKRGEWDHLLFDSVKFHSTVQRDSIVADSKDKKIGIIGAGASGLFSGFLLDSVGFHNYEILEASQRLGGRIHTAYFGKPEEYRYQEMGPMRIPYANKYKNKTLPVKDHQIVFKLADELNKRNDEKHHIKFIDWIEQNDDVLSYKNGIRLPNGQVPTKGDVKLNISLTLDLGDAGKEANTAFSEFDTDEWRTKMADDIYAAHQMFLDRGYDNWSEWGYVHNKLGKSLNVSALATEGQVDQGLNRIAEAFGPLLGNKVQFNTKVSKLVFTEDKMVAVQWKSSPFDPIYQSKTYDCVIVSAPFSVVRTWHLPEMSYTITKAIGTLQFSQACKVALEFKTRFWESGDRPIFGGCSVTDMATGRACYPPYRRPGADGSGPGVMLGSYISGDMGLRLAAMNEQDHVALVLENMVELHGEQARQQFTGNYKRYCGILDPYAACSWATPMAGQHSLFSPSYFQMEQGLVFVGEHTDVKHAWISAALASAHRGVVMILVEAGHVDDARKLVRDWNAWWLDI